MPKLSIITVCRNEEAGIAKTAESIVTQTWQDFEWIVIDGASTDGTLDKLKPYAGRIERLVSEPDSGIYNAMNKGIRLAQGEYLIFMNGGDAFHHPEVLEEVFAQNPDGDVLYGDATVFERGKERRRKAPPTISSPLYFVYGTISHQATFIRRELFLKYGEYDETLTLSSDHKHWIIFALNGCRFQYTGVITAMFDMNGLSRRRMDITRQEAVHVIEEYFHPGDLAQLPRETFVIWWRLFGRLPLLKIKSCGGKIRYLLFGALPLLTKAHR